LDCRLRIADCGFKNVKCGISDILGLRFWNLRLETSYFGLRNSDCGMLAVECLGLGTWDLKLGTLLRVIFRILIELKHFYQNGFVNINQ
jgi:hypothetical protein